MSYYEKYLKYKTKYVQLKNAVGAGDVSAIIKLTNADGKSVNPINLITPMIRKNQINPRIG
jgi:hypothetical protein